MSLALRVRLSSLTKFEPESDANDVSGATVVQISADAFSPGYTICERCLLNHTNQRN